MKLKPPLPPLKKLLLTISYSLLASNLNANELLTISVTNHQNDGIENVVISAFSQSQQAPSSTTAENKKVIDQIDKQFIHHVTAIQKGSQVNFPNYDQIRHHVYSFSATKSFEIPLYTGSPKTPIVFDKTGVVSLGCNIHDWMSAYIYVVDTPYFATTDRLGKASLDLPPGTYELHYWHPDMDQKNSHITSLVELSPESSHMASAQLSLKKVWKFRRGPLASFNRGGYR